MASYRKEFDDLTTITRGLGVSLSTGSNERYETGGVQRVGKQRKVALEARIGRGTYGDVWIARDTRGGKYALKVQNCRQAHEAYIAEREVRALQHLRECRNVVRIVDHASVRGRMHILLELLAAPLTHVILHDRVRLNTAVLTYQLLHGMHEMHRSEMIHRDVKPDNIILSSQGEAKYADLGMVDMRGHAAARRTPERTTLWYRAPELLQGGDFYDHRIDLWSLGCVLHEVFFGQPLFARETEIPMFRLICEAFGVIADVTARDLHECTAPRLLADAPRNEVLIRMRNRLVRMQPIARYDADQLLRILGWPHVAVPRSALDQSVKLSECFGAFGAQKRPRD